MIYEILDNQILEFCDRKIVFIKDLSNDKIHAFYQSHGTGGKSSKNQWVIFFGFSFCPLGGVWFIKHPKGKLFFDQTLNNISKWLSEKKLKINLSFYRSIDWLSENIFVKTKFLQDAVTINQIFERFLIPDVRRLRMKVDQLPNLIKTLKNFDNHIKVSCNK